MATSAPTTTANDLALIRLAETCIRPLALRRFLDSRHTM
jgi:hypothetical protein